MSIGSYRDGEDHGASSPDQSGGAAGRSHRQRDAQFQNRATAASASAHGSQSLLSQENTPPQTRSNWQSSALSPHSQCAPLGSASGGAMSGGRGGPTGPHFKAGPVKSVTKEESGEIESSELLHSIATRGAASGADRMDMDWPTSHYTKRSGDGGSSTQTPTSPDISHREAGLKSDGAGPSRVCRTAEPNGLQLVPNK